MLLLEENFSEKYKALAIAGSKEKLINLISSYRVVASDEMIEAIDSKSFFGVKTINVVGLLGSDPELGTTYESIIEDIAQANENPEVKGIVLNVNSPGGSVNGIMPAMLKIKASEKPVVSIVNDIAASAAYMIASQSDEILALHKMSSVGSVGVVLEMIDFTESMESEGVKVKTFTNTDSKFKRVDVNSVEGEKEIIRSLDDMYEVMETQIALGRDVTKDFIKSNFGQGRMLMAEKAVQNKMIDGVLSEDSFVNKKPEIVKMEEKTAVVVEDSKLILESERKRVKSWMQFVDVDAKIVREGVLSGEELDHGTAAILAQKQMVSISSAVEDNPVNVVAVASVDKDLKSAKVSAESEEKKLIELTKSILAERRVK